MSYVTRYFYWYQDICPCDIGHLWKYSLKCASVFYKHMFCSYILIQIGEKGINKQTQSKPKVRISGEKRKKSLPLRKQCDMVFMFLYILVYNQKSIAEFCQFKRIKTKILTKVVISCKIYDLVMTKVSHLTHYLFHIVHTQLI